MLSFRNLPPFSEIFCFLRSHFVESNFFLDKQIHHVFTYILKFFFAVFSACLAWVCLLVRWNCG